MCRRFGTLCSIFTGGVSRKNGYTTYEDGTECFETSAHKIQTLGTYPKERIQLSEHGESLISSLDNLFSTRRTKGWRLPLSTLQSVYLRRTTQHHISISWSQRPQSSPAERLLLFGNFPFLELGWPSAAAERLSCPLQGSYWWPDKRTCACIFTGPTTPECCF